MDEMKVTSTLRRWAAVDSEHRDDLLRRCLAVLEQGDCRRLGDGELDMLAAAGELFEGEGQGDRPFGTL